MLEPKLYVREVGLACGFGKSVFCRVRRSTPWTTASGNWDPIATGSFSMARPGTVWVEWTEYPFWILALVAPKSSPNIPNIYLGVLFRAFGVGIAAQGVKVSLHRWYRLQDENSSQWRRSFGFGP